MTKEWRSVKRHLWSAAVVAAIFAITACCFGAIAHAAGGTWTGNGSAENPYLIEDVADLQTLERYVNAGNSYGGKYFLLDRSLDLSSVCGESLGSWTPIGSEQRPFAGTLLGEGNEIYGLYVSSSSRGGLFGYVTGTVKEVYVSGIVKGYNYVGGITAVNAGTIEECNFDGIVQGNERVGGIAGQNQSVIRKSYSQGSVEAKGCAGGITGENSGTIDTCTNEAAIKQSGGSETIGGITGHNYGAIRRSLNNGSVTAEGKNIGGIAGSYTGGVIWSCSNKGNVSSNDECVGGVVGYASGDISLTDCVNNGVINNSKHSYAGGIAGKFLNTAQETGVIEDCTNGGKVSGGSHTGGIAGEVKGTEIKNCYNGGSVDGDEESAGVAGTLSSNASITSSTNAGVITGTKKTGGIVGYMNYSQGVSGCLNKGNVTGTSYTGGIAGIAEYNFPRAIGDTTVLYCTNTAKVVGEDYTGGIIGSTNANVKYSVNKGEIHGKDRVGGIAGRTFDGGAGLENDFNEGSVYGVGHVGGITGNAGYITILGCGNTGTVVGEKEFIGGIIGALTNGEVSDCYNRGIIYGDYRVGGIVGRFYGENIKMTRCYCKAPKTGLTSDTYGVDCANERHAGGLCGPRDAGTTVVMEDCYWWSPCAKHAMNGYKSGQDLGGDGYTHYHYESRFSDSSKFEHWDFSNMWEIRDGVPQLRKLSNAGGTGGTGGTGGSGVTLPYYINNVAEFLSFAEGVNNGYVQAGTRICLKADLDLTGIDWDPIGMERREFKAIFDGKNHVIKGLSVDSDSESAGLFGECGYSSSIRNLIVYGEVKNNEEFTGGIAGRSNGEIINCQFFGTVSGNQRFECNVGGIVGLNEGYVSDCLFSGTVSAQSTSMTSFAGGIAGRGYTVIRSMAFGTVSNDGYNESGGGGIVGKLEGGEIYACGHVGKVSEDGGYGGGVAGVIDNKNNGRIERSFHYGEIEYLGHYQTNNRIGGVLGQGKASALTDCYAFDVDFLDVVGNKKGSESGTRCESLRKEEFRDPKNFKKWDMDSFGRPWCLGPDYPLLQSFCNYARLLPNGGEGNPIVIGVLKAELKISEVASQELKIPSLSVKRNGFYFTSWNDAQDGSGKSYREGDVVPAKSTLFAQWTTSYHGYVPFEPESHAGALGATYDKMFDNDENTAWYVSGLAQDDTFSVEFVTKDYVIPNGYVFVTGNASWNDPGRNPKNWKLEAKKSQDGEWVVLDEVTNDTSLPGNARSQAVKMISNNEEYCFFRLTFWGFGAGDDFELSEFCLMTNTTRLPKVTLVPNVNEGESGLIQEGENQSSFNLPKTSTEVIGYVLRNWNTQADGKGQSFGLGDAYQINGDATLYAFRELETYEIIFDANGADPIDSLEYTIESMEKLPDPTREDYFFDGWKVVSDAGNWLEADELYAAGASLTGKYGDVTLKAQWTQIPKYVVTWKNYDGKVLKTDENVPQGTVPQYVGEEPTRKETEEFTYTFTGWDKTPEAIDGDAEYTAIFQETKRKYEITWKMDDGSVIDVTQVEYGVVPTHADPKKQETAEFTFTFTGWDVTPAKVQGTATYTAAFSENKRSYEISWLMDDGTLIDKTVVEFGVVPTHEDPKKQETEEYEFTFKGWNETPKAVEGNAVYAATFEGTKKCFVITWKDDLGNVIDVTEVEYGVVPTHADASKEATAEKTYVFSGWTPGITAAKAAAEYQAVFADSTNVYEITWLDDEGNLIDVTQVEYGTVPTHAALTKTETDEYSYEFKGWSPEIATVTDKATYQAVIEGTKKKYNVTWLTDEGKLIDVTQVEYGTVPTHEDPGKEATDEFTYAFNGWNVTPVAVQGTATYVATFSETKRSYEITWKMDDGSVIDVTQVEYGTVPTHGDPGKKATAEFTYAFTGWDAAPLAVTGPATYVATFDQTKRSYEITWKMDDGSVIDVETYAYGETPSHADADKAETEEWVYAFTGWKETPSMVTGPATYVATFSATKKASSSLTPPSGDPEDYLDELRKMIQYAISLGGERTITWAKGTGLPYDVLKTLEDHPQITLIFKYEYKNVSYEVTICGKDVETDPTVSWYGPLNLYSRYNLRVNVKDSDGAVKGTYVVRRGDNLSKLARRFNVTVDWLVKKNLIKNPNLIWVNQLLNY
ncbi:MAG: InlB B-repeat-containing protein [Lachnospiraceae bacterium]|nr:InlB B-repeat-containing protein [Lachnospiraceae bacterium]